MEFLALGFYMKSVDAARKDAAEGIQNTTGIFRTGINMASDKVA
jgi:hypothetical protein